MSFEDKVARSVIEDAGSHVMWYVNVYSAHLPGESAEQRGQRQAEIRSDLIKDENSWLHPTEVWSARLKIAEYLDSHPAAQKQITEFVHEHQGDNGTTIGRPDSAPGPDPAKVMQEQLERLEGNFLGALAQGVSNEIWPNDLQKSLEMAAPFVSGSEIIMGFGEGMKEHADLINEIREPFVERLDARDEIGREDIAEALKDIGSDTPATNFPSTTEELGNNTAEEMERALGAEKTEEILETRTPGEPLLGFGGYEAGNPHHPESPTEDAKEKETDVDGKEAEAPSATSTGVTTPDYTASPDGYAIPDYSATPDASPMLDYVATPDISSPPLDYSPIPDAASTPDYSAATPDHSSSPDYTAPDASIPDYNLTPDHSVVPDTVSMPDASLHPDATNSGIDGQSNYAAVDTGQSGASPVEPNYQDQTGAALHVGIDGNQSSSMPAGNTHPDVGQQTPAEHNDFDPGQM